MHHLNREHDIMENVSMFTEFLHESESQLWTMNLYLTERGKLPLKKASRKVFDIGKVKNPSIIFN